MPNIWTHILYGERVAKEAGLEDLIKENRNYFQLGAQGPDPFFYHNFFPGKRKPLTALGNKIHREQCGKFLTNMIRYGVKDKDSKRHAYILGFITHHLLDRSTHPYINYRSGNEGNRHQKLEVIIDTLLMKRWKNVETYKEKVYKELYIGKSLYEPIKEMLTHLIDDTFPEDTHTFPSDYVNRSYQHMIRALKILHDQTGLKNKLLKELVAPFSYQKQVDDVDYLNEKETKWIHPTNDQEESTESFLTLFHKAEVEGIEILSLVDEYWKTGDDNLFALIEDKISDISYDTGKACSLGLENRYFEPIV